MIVLIKVSELNPGMRIGKDVRNLQGALLLAKDREISEKDIWVLKSWGVAEAWVEGGPRTGGQELAELEQEAQMFIINELKERFSEVLNDPIMVEIMESAARQLQKRLRKREEQT